MLFIQSNSLARPLDERARLRLLDALRARGHTPLVRSARQRLFRLLTADFAPSTFPDSSTRADAAADPAAELERLTSARPVPEGAAYTPGELFRATDCLFFVVFGREPGEELAAGLVYNVATAEPLARLERFCREVGDALLDVAEAEKDAAQAVAAGAAGREAAGDDARATADETGRDAAGETERRAPNDDEVEVKNEAEGDAGPDAADDSGRAAKNEVEAASGVEPEDGDETDGEVKAESEVKTASGVDSENRVGPESGIESKSGVGTESKRTESAPRETPRWRPRSRGSAHALARFVAARPADFAVAAKVRGGAHGLFRASELMERGEVRSFLRRVQELRREGYSPRRLFAEAGGGRVPVEEMLTAGLLEREVRVSCRKSGHALFDLPSPDSLAAITISRAKCSLCAAPVSDEVVEETINPTRLAVSLLENGGWLANRVYKIVRSLGVPESEIATGPAAEHGESYLAANVCGNSFLFAARDGDLTPAFARRVAETVADTETAHLVVVTTGAVEEEGRMRLYEFAWRRARDGHDLGITLVEGTASARAEIERAFESALRRELSRQLFTLNAALGLDASDFVLDWFKLSNASADAPPSSDNAGHAHAALVPVFAPFDERAAS